MRWNLILNQIVKTPTQLKHENNFVHHIIHVLHRISRGSSTANSKSELSKLLWTQFWPKFKGSFLEQFWTFFNSHCDICLENICPGDICPHQKYLGCYWPDFDQALKVGSSCNFGIGNSQKKSQASLEHIEVISLAILYFRVTFKIVKKLANIEKLINLQKNW